MKLSKDLTEVYVALGFLLSSEHQFPNFEVAQQFPQNSSIQPIFYV